VVPLGTDEATVLPLHCDICPFLAEYKFADCGVAFGPAPPGAAECGCDRGAERPEELGAREEVACFSSSSSRCSSSMRAFTWLTWLLLAALEDPTAWCFRLNNGLAE